MKNKNKFSWYEEENEFDSYFPIIKEVKLYDNKQKSRDIRYEVLVYERKNNKFLFKHKFNNFDDAYDCSMKFTSKTWKTKLNEVN